MSRTIMAPRPLIVLVVLLVTTVLIAGEPTEDIESQRRKAQSQLSTMLVERRDMRRQYVEQCGELWRACSGMTLREYIKSTARLLEAELDLCETPASRMAACQKHVEETERIRESVEDKAARQGRVVLEELAAQACCLQAQILLAEEESATERRQARIKVTRIEQAGILRKYVKQYRNLWHRTSGVTLKDYVDCAAELAEVERKLSTTPAERIAACERLLGLTKSACEVAKVQRATGRASEQAEYTCRAARADAAISLHRARVAAGYVEDLDDAQLHQMLTDRLQFYRMHMEHAQATFSVTGDMATNFHTAFVDFARAALELRHTSAGRVAVHEMIVKALKWHEERLEQKVRLGMETADTLTYARAERIQAEIELLRERIHGDYWGPARQGPEFEPPAAEHRN